MTQQTGLKCLKCSAPVLRVTQADTAPPWQWSVLLVCRDCGEHHVHFEGKLALRNYPQGPVVDIGDEEAMARGSRVVYRGVCGRPETIEE